MEQSEKKESIFSKPWVQSLVGIIVIVLALGGLLFWKSLSSHVSIDNSQVLAPTIAIGPQTEGILQEVDVQPGDTVTAGETVARVGSEILTAQINGLVIATQNTPGQVIMPGTAVVSMIDPTQLRVVGTIEEDKGLDDIKVGQPATFTLDAFGNEKFTGVVDQISPTSDESSIVFDISDEREEQNFDVKVRYNIADHPEFKNGMSAKLTIYTK
jgi:multidrug resistance efflux pump